jgi:hypothetical protein
MFRILRTSTKLRKIYNPNIITKRYCSTNNYKQSEQSKLINELSKINNNLNSINSACSVLCVVSGGILGTIIVKR